MTHSILRKNASWYQLHQLQDKSPYIHKKIKFSQGILAILATSSNTQGTKTPNQYMDRELKFQIWPSSGQKWARTTPSPTEILAIKMAKNVLLNSPGPAQRHKNTSSPLALFIGDIISIIPEIFENLKILTPKNAVAPVWNHGLGQLRPKVAKPDRPKIIFFKTFWNAWDNPPQWK